MAWYVGVVVCLLRAGVSWAVCGMHRAGALVGPGACEFGCGGKREEGREERGGGGGGR